MNETDLKRLELFGQLPYDLQDRLAVQGGIKVPDNFGYQLDLSYDNPRIKNPMLLTNFLKNTKVPWVNNNKDVIDTLQKALPMVNVEKIPRAMNREFGDLNLAFGASISEGKTKMSKNDKRKIAKEFGDPIFTNRINDRELITKKGGKKFLQNYANSFDVADNIFFRIVNPVDINLGRRPELTYKGVKNEKTDAAAAKIQGAIRRRLKK